MKYFMSVNQNQRSMYEVEADTVEEAEAKVVELFENEEDAAYDIQYGPYEVELGDIVKPREIRVEL